MKSTFNRILGGFGTAVGIAMFLALLPSGATLIFRLLTRERGSDTVPMFTFALDIVFSLTAAALQAAGLTFMGLFLTVGRRKGLASSCAFLFCGMVTNMLFAGICTLFCDSADRLPVLYCLATGLLFLISALALSLRDSNVKA